MTDIRCRMADVRCF